MLFGRKSDRFIPTDPSQLKMDFEGEAELKEEWEYAAVQAAAPTRVKEPAVRRVKPAQEGQRRIFSDHLEHRTRSSNPDEIPADGKLRNTSIGPQQSRTLCLCIVPCFADTRTQELSFLP